MNVLHKRVEWIDVCKGLGIILVVLGHTPIPMFLGDLIFSFHMPLFFFLSGYLFQSNKYKNFFSFFKRKVHTILVPYAFFATIVYLFWVFIGRTHGDGSRIDIPVWKPLVGIFYSVGTDDWLVFNIPLWFLTCIMVVEIAFFAISKQPENKIILITIVCSIIGCFLSLFLPFRLPWSLDTAFTGLVFFSNGYLLRENIKKLLKLNKLSRFIIALLLITLNILFVHLNGRIDMNSNTYNNYFYFYIAAFTGIFSVILISQLIKKNKILSYFGVYSLIVLALHVTSFSIVNVFLQVIFSFIKVDILINGLSLTIGSFIVLWPAIYILNRFFPFLIGKRVSKISNSIQIKLKSTEV